MWVVTKSDWPVLVNLARAAHIGYQQVAKYNARTRVVASMWEQEFVLADCADGDEAKALIDRISVALASGADILDLRATERMQNDASAVAKQS